MKLPLDEKIDTVTHCDYIFKRFPDKRLIGEAQALLWDKDINFEEKTLTVSKSMYYKSANEFYIKEPKTKAGNRVIALDDDTIRYLLEWRKLQEKNVPTKYVLSYNGIPINKSTAKHIIE